jgi:hypothetical protein
MSQLTGNWPEFVKGVSARIDEIIVDTQDMAPSFMSIGLHKQDTADGLIYRTTGVTGLGYLEIFDEGDAIKEDRTYPAYSTEYVMKQSGKMTSISQMLAKTRMSELESKLGEVKENMNAAMKTLNRWAWQPLIDAFVTTDSVSNFPTARLNDAVSFINASHPSKVPGVAVRSNVISGNPVLDKTSLWTGIKQLKEMLNGRGLPLNYQGKITLVVPVALEKMAVELTASVLAPYTTDNQLNYYQGIVDVAVVDYIGATNGGSDTAWFLIAKDVGDQKSLRYVSLIAPKIEKDVDFATKAIKVSVDMACAFGYSNFEFIVGSTGLAT